MKDESESHVVAISAAEKNGERTEPSITYFASGFGLATAGGGRGILRSRNALQAKTWLYLPVNVDRAARIK
jgi:hypothetical protein